MQVFRNYFKILKSAKKTILIYMGIFIILAILIGYFSKDNSSTVFEQSKSDITIINRDKDTPLSNALKDYLSKSCEFIDIEDDKDELMDALFFQRIDYVLIIPENFSEKFMNGEDVKLEKLTRNSIDDNYTDLAINNFISTAKVFYENGQNYTQDQIIDFIKDSLATNVKVSLNSEKSAESSYSYLALYLNYFVYLFIVVFIIGISLVMSAYQNLDTKRRNLAAPLSIKKINTQLFLGNMVYTTISALILIIVGFVVARQTIFDLHSILFIINALIFSLCALSIGFLISQFTLRREAVIGISNVLSLGLSFISGAFVPLELLNDMVIRIAMFSPAYWFVSGNLIIAEAPEITQKVVMTILGHMGIQLLFALALFFLAFVVAKANRTKEA